MLLSKTSRHSLGRTHSHSTSHPCQGRAHLARLSTCPRRHSPVLAASCKHTVRTTCLLQAGPVRVVAAAQVAAGPHPHCLQLLLGSCWAGQLPMPLGSTHPWGTATCMSACLQAREEKMGLRTMVPVCTCMCMQAHSAHVAQQLQLVSRLILGCGLQQQ